MHSIKLLLLLPLLIGSTFLASATPPLDHSQWEQLLKKHVNTKGDVNYKGFIEDKVLLEEYLSLVSITPPDKKTWTEAEQLAYWINAYNAFTVKLIVDHYPIKSIKDIKKGIIFVNSVWDIDFFTIGGKKMNLNDIEHGIIRKKFDEPRIHFALNCASFSCPQLRSEAFTATQLEAQLNDQTHRFLADTRKNKITNTKKIIISNIFKWYSTDFTKQGFLSRFFGKKRREQQLLKFVAPYTRQTFTKNTKIEFMDYGWTLNEA